MIVAKIKVNLEFVARSYLYFKREVLFERRPISKLFK